MTVLQALSSAGFTQFANLKAIYLLRNAKRQADENAALITKMRLKGAAISKISCSNREIRLLFRNLLATSRKKEMPMKKGRALYDPDAGLLAASVAWAQSDEHPTASSSPVPAFGQENSVPLVSENPPISAIDQPGLEPHAAPESFLLTGPAFQRVGRFQRGRQRGRVVDRRRNSRHGKPDAAKALEKLRRGRRTTSEAWPTTRTWDVGLEQLQQFDIDNRINWKRGQLAIRDSFSYLPEGTFGFAAYGGGWAYNVGMGSLGAGMLGAGAFGGQSNAFNGGKRHYHLGEVPRITNLGLVDVVEELTPKSSVTAVARATDLSTSTVISIPRLTGATTNIDFIGSREEHSVRSRMTAFSTRKTRSQSVTATRDLTFPPWAPRFIPT